MWAFLTGYFFTFFFESQIIELFKNKFSNKTLSFNGILIGWFCQEYIREEYTLTGGKRFMIESDFRNRLLTQVFKIFRNLIFYFYATIAIELIPLLIVFKYFVYILYKAYLPSLKNFMVNTKAIKNLQYNLYIKLYDISLIVILIYIFKKLFTTNFFYYDIFFLIKPIFLIGICLKYITSVLFLGYLIYVYLTYKISKNIALTIKVFIVQFVLYLSLIIFYLAITLKDFELHIYISENCFKEVFFKIIIILFTTFI